MTAEFSYNRLGALPFNPAEGAPVCTSPRVNAAPAGYVWFFDLLTKELHHTKLSDWQISLVVIGLERMIPPDDFVAIELQAKAAVIAKLQELKDKYPASDAVQAITAGLLDLISRTHIDPAPATLDRDQQFWAQTAELDEAVSASEADGVGVDGEAETAIDWENAVCEPVPEALAAKKEAESAQDAAEASQETAPETAPGPKRKKKKKHA